jgi:hypothetical protein
MIDLFINPDLFRVINEYTDLRNLCDACKLLSTLKTYITYKLTKEYSFMYYDDVLFRNRVLNKICNPYKQLYLNLSDCDITDVSDCDITDVSALGNVHTLNLSLCDNITDVSALGNVTSLNLNCCKNITDVSMLGKVNTLNVSGCNITDVSALGEVHILGLSDCEN